MLTPKQKSHFSRSLIAFELWAESRTPDEIELAIHEIEKFLEDLKFAPVMTNAIAGEQRTYECHPHRGVYRS
jgi:hypothetical protein